MSFIVVFLFLKAHRLTGRFNLSKWVKQFTENVAKIDFLILLANLIDN